MKPEFDNNLPDFFTDVVYLRSLFNNFLSAPKLPKPIIVIHGIGGAGKSSLLSMFRYQCFNEKIPSALASGGNAKSISDVVLRWMENLKADGVDFPSLGKTIKSYRTIQAKVNDRAKPAQDAGNPIAKIVGKAASKAVETAGGTMLGGVIGSVIPGIGTVIGGTLGSIIGGMGADALTEWLSGFLKKSDIDLLLEPEKILTANFLADIEKAAKKKRIVLLLDTYEQMIVLDDWIRQIAQKKAPNVLLVIAGRVKPNWELSWPGWMANAEIEELKPMTIDIMRELIQRYYAKMNEGKPESTPDPVQVEAIANFARGLPMAVTSAVQLWMVYHVQDFQTVKVEVVANLVDYLMKGVPDRLIPVLEAAAVVRWFDQPILRAVTGLEDVRNFYNELRKFPFMRSRDGGIALHDSIREIINENLRVQDSERYSELHEQAALYYERKLNMSVGEDATNLGLERLYHRICVDEETGIQLFQEMAEELTRYENVHHLQIILNDINNYQLRRSDSCQWREYYHLRFKMLNGERISLANHFRSLVKEAIQPKLRAYALCDLGEILMDRDTFRTTNEEAKKVLEQAIPLFSKKDSKLISAYITLRGYYAFRGDWETGMEMAKKRLKLCQEMYDEWGVTKTLREIAFAYGWAGDWRKAMDLNNEVHQRLKSFGGNNFLKAELHLRPWNLLWTGRVKEAENGLREAIEILTNIGHFDQMFPAKRDLAFSLNLQECFDSSQKIFQDLFACFNPESGKKGELGTLLGFWAYSKAREGDLVEARKLLEKSWQLKNELGDVVGYQETLNWFGYICELEALLDNSRLIKAEEYYLQSLKNKQYSRHHFECGSLTSLVRVKFAQGDYISIPPLLAEAEQLANQYEYNEHLASLRLIQGHIAWKNKKTDQVLSFYQQALIFALRFNRFSLDELLRGREQGSPFRPIISYCRERGEEGTKVLLALTDWWAKGINDIGSPRPDSISPIPEGIPLLEAERIARNREPGDGLIQNSVLEQIAIGLG